MRRAARESGEFVDMKKSVSENDTQTLLLTPPADGSVVGSVESVGSASSTANSSVVLVVVVVVVVVYRNRRHVRTKEGTISTTLSSNEIGIETSTYRCCRRRRRTCSGCSLFSLFRML